MKNILLLTILIASIFACQSKKTDTETDQKSFGKVVELDILTNEKIAPIQPTMWGLFFEDINFAADGGINAQMIKNNSFEFQNPMMGWQRIQENGAKGYFYTKSSNSTSNKKYIQVERINSDGNLGIQNDGFRGLGLKENNVYTISFNARQNDGTALALRFQLFDSKYNQVGETELSGFTKDWKNYEISITAKTSDNNGHFRMLVDGVGTMDFDLISMYPVETWNKKKQGLRKDLVQLLADMKPGFLRFPGGCIVEGFELGNRYEWKKTVGPLEDRPVKINRWNFEFAHKSAPDYYQSFSMGFFEYFQLAEDIGATPLPIISCGLACQFNSGEIVPLDKLDPYIQDALDLIEFANGSANSAWGSVRKKMGHPEPFNLKFIGIGNEQWGPQYIERAKAFQKALTEKYPDVTIVSTSGPFSDGEEFTYLWGELLKMNAQLIDEHYYKSPDWFFENARRYDDYDRNGPKIFAGEYAAHTKSVGSTENVNCWLSALAEAAFMTGLERNADVVHLASYAPLFAHIDAWQWSPDLIWFDNLRSMGTPNYYVQKLFSTNKGTTLIKVTSEGETLAGEGNLYASATLDSNTNEVILKLVNSSKEKCAIHLNLDEAVATTGKMLKMSNDDLYAVNTLDNPTNISPIEKPLTNEEIKGTISLDGNSLTILRVVMGK